MNWNSDEGQIILSVAYALQDNKSNAAATAKEKIAKLVPQRVYSQYDYELHKVVYALQPFGDTNSNKRRGYSIGVGGRKSISSELIAEIKAKRLEGMTVREIARTLGVGVGTVSKYME